MTTSPPTASIPKTIGVLALQGGFSEHINVLSHLDSITTIQVKTIAQLNLCDGLIIPGGESTAISLSLIRNNLMDPLRSFVASKPVWGTCAGLILLSNSTNGNGKKSPELIGGLDVSTIRNVFGSQLQSFIKPVEIKGFDYPLPGVFIRAPGIESVGPGVEVLGKLGDKVVAVRQGHILATCFHPELTNDKRFHEYFVKMLG